MSGSMLVLNVLQPLEDAVTWILKHFHYQLGLPWAWAIVATTIVVRIALVPLTVRQIHSMQALQKHAPEMKAIQQRHKGGDKQKMNAEMMAFYKENHINPAASCLPMLAQFPVFISLYLVLKHFKRLIPEAANQDLSWLHFVPTITAKADSHWSGFVLLGVYLLSQVLSSYFMSTTMDKMQRRLLMVLPLLFISVIAHFPTGLVLYWVTTNLWTVGQGLVTRRLVPKAVPGATLPAGPKRSSRTPPAVSAGNGTTAVSPKPRPTPPSGPRRVKRNKGPNRK
ncbi:MAG TPA: YidC/Oxa1 family membrane protein insertase [Gaiellaceae bacterium]